MMDKLLINIVIIAAVCVGGVYYLSGKSEPSESPAPAATVTESQPKPRQTAPRSASVVSIPKDLRSGQYLTKGRVNSGYIDFLVDTGASAVVLTLDDAKRAGVRNYDLRYNVPVNTAGGRVYAAKVTLDSVSLGGITLRDIDAFVIEDGLEISLLGMTFLGQLQKVEATPNALLLRL